MNDDEPLARVGITTRLSTYSDMLVVGDPKAPAIAKRLEAILKNYPMTYDSLTAALAKRYSDFMVNAKYHTLRRALEAERKFCFPHRLNPTKPKGAVQRLYNSNIFQEFDKHCAEPNAVNRRVIANPLAELLRTDGWLCFGNDWVRIS